MRSFDLYLSNFFSINYFGIYSHLTNAVWSYLFLKNKVHRETEISDWYCPIFNISNVSYILCQARNQGGNRTIVPQKFSKTTGQLFPRNFQNQPDNCSPEIFKNNRTIVPQKFSKTVLVVRYNNRLQSFFSRKYQLVEALICVTTKCPAFCCPAFCSYALHFVALHHFVLMPCKMPCILFLESQIFFAFTPKLKKVECCCLKRYFQRNQHMSTFVLNFSLKRWILSKKRRTNSFTSNIAKFYSAIFKATCPLRRVAGTEALGRFKMPQDFQQRLVAFLAPHHDRINKKQRCNQAT